MRQRPFVLNSKSRRNALSSRYLKIIRPEKVLEPTTVDPSNVQSLPNHMSASPTNAPLATAACQRSEPAANV